MSDLSKLDAGPWMVFENGAGVISDDFTHDVILKISGDFADNSDRAAYAEALAAKLNSNNEARSVSHKLTDEQREAILTRVYRAPFLTAGQVIDAVEEACTSPMLARIAELEAESERLRSELERINGEHCAPLASTESRYRDLLQRLGVQGHDGAIAEISCLRARAGLE